MVKKATTEENKDDMPVVKRSKHTVWHEHLKRFGSTEGERCSNN